MLHGILYIEISHCVKGFGLIPHHGGAVSPAIWPLCGRHEQGSLPFAVTISLGRWLASGEIYDRAL